MAGRQCRKLQWYRENARDEIAEPDFSTRFMFKQGALVGEYAKKLFPGGIDLGGDKEYWGAAGQDFRNTA